jgi:hypothetical protein
MKSFLRIILKLSPFLKAYRLSLVDVVFALAAVFALHLLLSQLSSLTLADLTSPKNGWERLTLVLVGSVALFSRLRCLPRAQASQVAPTQAPWGMPDTSAWWLSLFVAILYPHGLVWMILFAGLVVLRLHHFSQLVEDERSAALSLLGFAPSASIIMPAVPQAPRETLKTALLISVLLSTAISQALQIMSSGPGPSFFLWAPLYLMFGAFMVSLAAKPHPSWRESRP